MTLKRKILVGLLSIVALVAGVFALTSCSDGHNWEVFVDDTSCTEKGYIVYICVDCGETKTEHKNALGHNWETKTIAATCATDGYTVKVCSRCKQEKDKTITESATGNHTYNENDVCTRCGARRPSEGLEYKGGRDYYNVSIGTCTDTELIISGTYKGLPVIIGREAFENCTSITSVVIENGMTEIGFGAFSGCSSLTNIEIPDSVTFIEQSAFKNCTSLKSVTLGTGITQISGDTFSNCTSLVSIDIPNNITAIYSDAFSNCTSLTKITIPDSVTYIGDDAFIECTSLTRLSI